MNVYRGADGEASIELGHDEVLQLLSAFALSMAAYGVLQNFMTPGQKAWALPSIAFISRLGALLGEGEDFDAPDGRSEVAGDAELAAPGD